MSCPGLSREDYQLYVLGLSEPDSALTIRTHLAEGCRDCTTELGDSVVFWYQFALVGAEESTAEPRPGLRRQVLAGVIGTQAPRRPPVLHWSWPQAVAAAVALMMVSALSWYVGNQGLLRRAQTPPVVATQPAPPAQPQEDVQALRERLRKAEQALAERPTPAPVERPPGRAPEIAALEQALNESRRDLADARQALAQQQTRAAALENELQTQRNLLATAVRERQDAENRARSLAGDQAKADERDRQIRALTSRVQELERENAEFRNLVNRQRREIEQSLQVASLLSSLSLRLVKLQPTEKGAAAVGYAFMQDGRVIFSATGLPDLPPGRIYQLWLIRRRAPAIVSGGLFSAGRQQRAMFEFRDPQLVSRITALAVTDEPAGGSPLPTGHKFLIGSAPSS